MTRWPIWRLLIWIELWVLAVAAFHTYQPIHDAFVVPLLIGIVPGGVLVAMWALARGATALRPAGDERANIFELLIAAITVIAAGSWVVRWTLEARADLQRIDDVLGEATVIVDVSLTWLSLGACVVALTLDGVLATAHEQLRETMNWLRRTHVLVTVIHVVALFGSAWLVTRVPEAGTADSAAFFERARAALHVYEYCKATVFPVQSLFASLAIAIVALDTRS